MARRPKPPAAEKAAQEAPESAVVLPIHRRPAHLARRFHLLTAGITAKALSEQPLGPLQYAALTSLFDEPGIDQKRLAATMGIDRTNTGVVVDQLEAMGLLSRRPSASDRRSNELRLTSKGIAMRRRLRPHLLAANERILAVLSKVERELLLDLLVRVIEANGQYAIPGAGRRPRGSLVDSK